MGDGLLYKTNIATAADMDQDGWLVDTEITKKREWK